MAILRRSRAGRVRSVVTWRRSVLRAVSVTASAAAVMMPLAAHGLEQVTLGSLTTLAGPLNDLDGNGPDVGDTIAYTFTVTNTGTTILTSVTINDPTIVGVSCPVGTVAPGGTAVCTGTYALTPADVSAGRVDSSATANVVSAVGTATTSAATASTTFTVDQPTSAPDETSTTDTSSKADTGKERDDDAETTAPSPKTPIESSTASPTMPKATSATSTGQRAQVQSVDPVARRVVKDVTAKRGATVVGVSGTRTVGYRTASAPSRDRGIGTADGEGTAFSGVTAGTGGVALSTGIRLLPATGAGDLLVPLGLLGLVMVGAGLATVRRGRPVDDCVRPGG